MIEAHARHTDPRTSHQAARAMTPELTDIQKRVLAFAKRCGGRGFTDLELEEEFHDHGATFRTRRRELVDMRMIRDSGQTTRYAGDRRHRIIWVIR